MNDRSDTVRLSDILRGVMRSLPDTLTVNKGLLTMALLKPGRIGSIGYVIEKRAKQHPDRIALRFEDRSWTYEEFNALANRIAAVLDARGVKPGDAVAVLMENRPEVLACVAGIVKLGAVAGMINHQQRGEVLAHSLKLTDARAYIVGSECMAALESTDLGPGSQPKAAWLWDGEGKPPRGFVRLADEIAEASEENPAYTRRIKQSDRAFLIFTSGTTGLPKASVMTHYRWLRSMAGLGLAALRLKPDDVLYCALPLYHNNALTVSWSAALGGGCTLALGRKFSASKFWDEIRRYDASSFCYIGELCRYLLNQPPKPTDRQHRVRVICGNGLRPEIWEQFQSRFGIERINEFYGASESNLAFVNGFDVAKTAGYCPLPFAIVGFDADADAPRRDARGFMKKVPKGGVGLLVTEISDNAPFDGYTDKRASEGKLLRDVFAKGDCWFNTGDLVRDQGWKHIQFVDRVGDTFRWKGENVATTEVEGVLGEHPDIEEAAVYGVQVPNSDGRAGMAALTLKAKSFDGASLAQHLTGALPAYAVPLFVRLRQSHETTATFKFRKVDLKREGFDPAQATDPLYVLLDRARGYEPLTAAIFAGIARGDVRL
jgi:acyl-CoA synthetase (AMP-forming)/AMP-acid ligase II